MVLAWINFGWLWCRGDGVSTISSDSNEASPGNNSDHKRKQPAMDMETPSPSKLKKIASGDGSEQSSSQNNSGGKQQKREKLDWNVLGPPKAQTKRNWSCEVFLHMYHNCTL